ncbi:Transcriptional activator protein CzcR [compost metagenome]
MPEILLVEDNPDTVEFLVRRLNDFGYGVRIARNGIEALHAIEDFIPAAVILDINLPLMNGDDVCRKMRQNPRTAEVPVIFVTAESEDRVRDLLDPNRTICLEKAIKVKSLVMALESLGLVPQPGQTLAQQPEQ